MTVDIKDLKRKAEAATPGRWQWFGNTKMNEVYLATVDGGQQFVMDFVRWGMRGAQPRFQVRIDGPGTGIMRALGELGAKEHPFGPKFEASHRRHFTGIGHPDADHIAANSPDVTLALVARIEQLEAACSLAASVITAVRQRPWPNAQRDDDDLDEVASTLSAIAARGIP